MALNEYRPGTAFSGVIGRTHRRVDPGVAGAGARQAGRAERAVHRHRRHRLRPARLLRQPDQHAEPGRAGRRTACSTPTCTPRRCARRSRSCILTGRNHHSNAHGLHHRGSARAIPAPTATSRSRTASSRRSCCSTATTPTRRQVAPDAGRTDQRRRAVRPLAAGARLRALLRLPRRRHPPVLSGAGLRQPPGRAAEDAGGGLSPDRGPGRQGHQLHRRRQAGRARQAVLPVLRHRRAARAAPRRRRSGPTSTRASSTTAGTPTARRCSARRRSSGIVPRTP